MSRAGLAAALGGAVLALFLVSLSIGPAEIGMARGFSALASGGTGPEALIMRELRLPRALLAVLVGAALGASGAALQGYLRNPLAEPGLLGVSGGAALGAVLAIQTGLAAGFALGLPLAALAGATVTVLLIVLLAGPRGGSLTVILAGIAVSAMAGAGTALVLSLSPNPFAVNEIVFWMMGSLADRPMSFVWLTGPLIVVGLAGLMATTRALDALTLGEDAADALGFALGRVRLILVLSVASAVGAATAAAGAIGFVGLVVPHLLRRAVGGRPSDLVWASALGGAVLVLTADIVVRLAWPDRDIKLGVVMALIGAPLFLHLIYKTRREIL